MNHKISFCLWFDNQAQQAAAFYTDTFQDAKVQEDSGMTVTFSIGERKFMALNGGPMFKINPSVSFFVFCPTEDEVEKLWAKLSDEGYVMMPLNNYPWSEKYGWCKDKFGVNWQIMLTKNGLAEVVPALMFTGDVAGKAEEAMQYYTSIFGESEIVDISRYKEGEGDIDGRINHARFILMGQSFIAFDSSYNHGYVFNEGISFVVFCDTQQEIDDYWKKLTDGGHESQCGWLKDKYGLSWQVVPSILGSLMSDPIKRPRVIEAFMKMKKFNIEALIGA